MKDFAQFILQTSRQIQEDSNELSRPSAKGEKPKTEYVIDFALVAGSRGYIERIVNQINGSYEHGWYDACAVMLRRLIETLIIEVFEYHNIASKIQNSDGDYLYLKDLVNLMLGETQWNLGRNTKKALPKLKDIGDQSAHSRRFNANRTDLEKLLPELRTVIQELMYLANLQ